MGAILQTTVSIDFHDKIVSKLKKTEVCTWSAYDRVFIAYTVQKMIHNMKQKTNYFCDAK